MPYIPSAERPDINAALIRLPKLRSAGQLNYVITAVCHQHLLGKYEVQYEDINAIIGALEAAKLEFYAMIARPYEDQKRAQNGAVGSLDEGAP